MEFFYARFRTLSPLLQVSHDGQLRTMYVHSTEGEPIAVPVLSGNSFGGRIRREIAVGLIDTLQIPLSLYVEGNRHLRSTYHSMMSGGALEKKGRIHPKDAMAVARALPIFDLLGGVYGDTFVSSSCVLYSAMPALKVLAPLYYDIDPNSLEDKAVEDIFTKGEAWAQWRMPDTRVSLPDVESTDETRQEKSPFRNMPVSCDYVLPGVSFLWRFGLHDSVSALGWSMFGYALARMAQTPLLGGRRKGGFGLVQWEMPQDPRLDSAAFIQWLHENEVQLRGILISEKGFVKAILEGQQ